MVLLTVLYTVCKWNVFTVPEKKYFFDDGYIYIHHAWSLRLGLQIF